MFWYCRFFAKYPEHLHYFQFQQITSGVTELMNNKHFQAHGLTVLSFIDTLITHGLSDAEFYHCLVLKITRSHFKRKLTSIPIEVRFVWVYSMSKMDGQHRDVVNHKHFLIATFLFYNICSIHKFSVSRKLSSTCEFNDIRHNMLLFF